MKSIVVLASGSGTNFINIYNNIKKGKIHGEIKLLISNNFSCGAVKFANNNNIQCKIIDYRASNVNSQYQEYLQLFNPDLILLAGFIKKIPSNIVKEFRNKIINIHPSLLPKYGGKGYYGLRVHQAVLDSNDSITGVTIHFVDENYDSGKIIAQEVIKIRKNDTAISLSKRVLNLEYKLYKKVVRLFCDDKILNNKNKILNI